MKNLKDLFSAKKDTGLIREFDDNYYDKIRVYRSRYVTDIQSTADYALLTRSDPMFHFERIYFEDLHLREEEHALPIEEDADISDDLLLSYIRSSDIDIVNSWANTTGNTSKSGSASTNGKSGCGYGI